MYCDTCYKKTAAGGENIRVDIINLVILEGMGEARWREELCKGPGAGKGWEICSIPTMGGEVSSLTAVWKWS